MKQNLLQSGRKHLVITNIQNFIWLFFSLIFSLSCNTNSEKKTDDKKDSTQTDKDGPKAAIIKTFSQYKINKTDIPFGTQYNKLVLNISLDDLANPSKMGLVYYAVNSTVEPNQILIPPGTAKDTLTASFYTKGILISNNELILSDYQSLNFDYLLLNPMRNNANLGFSVSAYSYGVGSDMPVTLPQIAQETKPSPPAPPAFSIPK